MKERRRDSRIPLVLEVRLRCVGQETMVLSADVSRRGMFVRSVKSMPETQLTRLDVHVPGESSAINMMAKVARSLPLLKSMMGFGMPGVGLEFFCLSGEHLSKWERLVRHARILFDQQPGLDGYAMYQKLEQQTQEGGDLQNEEQAGRPLSDRTHLIFRAHTMERLTEFLNHDLVRGIFDMNIPYRMKQGTPLDLRIIHPRTDEEFLVPGIAQQSRHSARLLVRFEANRGKILKEFQQFVVTGVSGVPETGASCPA